MKTIARVLFTVLAAFILITGPSVGASPLIYEQGFDGQSGYGPSIVWPAFGANSEVTDEFNIVANIDRVVALGSAYSHTANFQGVHVRFYEFGADNKPGALQREYFLAAGDPNVSIDIFGEISATLSPAFAATGRHFLSVQPVIDYWYWWSSSSGAPRGEAFYFRNNAIGEAWHHGDNLNFSINADVMFSLYGTVTSAGVITGLSENTLPRSGYLEIFGTNFGGDGSVMIGGMSAPVANWSGTRIVAYVPENAPLGSLSVQVVNAAGSSNTTPLVVTTRPAAADHVNWRFRMDGPYSFVRPAIAADGTVYSVDAFAHLYALMPDGGLKWLVRGAGDKGVALGPDGTIYVASENNISAYNPDGSAKWTFVQNPRALTCLGVSVGPDGNIYSVGTNGMGVFSLTPAGTLRWTNPEPYRRPIVDYGEIVFGPNGGTHNLYFSANTHLRAVRLDGASVFTVTRGQPAVAPDGSVHNSLSSFSPNGNLLWTFPTPYPANVFTAPDIGSDGTHYFGQNLIQLFALNPDGSQRWHTTVNGYVDGPVVNPQNTQLLMGSADTLDHPGFILSASAQDGSERWRLILPMEGGFNQFPNTRARFSADGQTAYVITGTATGDNNTSRSFVYSLNTTNGAPLLPINVVSRKTHGTAGAFDINLPLTGTPGVECRNGGMNGDHEIVFTFASAVTVSGATITPAVGMLGSMSGTPVISPDGRNITLHLTNVTNGQTVMMTLGLNNNTSTITVPMSFLAGDTNGDRVVNSGDTLQTRNRSGQATDATDFRSDVNADGTVNSGDTFIVRSRSGNFLP